jgi:predicted Fe-Mo cluster-binding NifX family protein
MGQVIGFCILKGRIAPRFDQPRSLVVITLDDQRRIVKRREYLTAHIDRKEACKMVASLGVSVLICGGLLQECEHFFSNTGILVIDNVIGNLDTVLNCYLRGELSSGCVLD